MVGGRILKGKDFVQFLLFIATVGVVLLLLRQFVFTPVIVKGDSMDPTLADGERVIALKNTEIKRFDVVTFPAPDEPGKNYIKRVIGLPGDTLRYEDDVLYINDKAVEEPYLDEYKSKLTDGRPLTDNFSLEQLTGVAKVPDGELFVMGDNRRISKDSRYIGFINEKDIMGDVKWVFWPIDRFGPIKD